MNLTTRDIVEKISYFRTKKKLSARKLSLAIGKSEPYIHTLEQGGFDLSLQALLDILEVLEISPEEFFYRNEKQYELDIKLIRYIQKLREDQKEAILNLYK